MSAFEVEWPKDLNEREGRSEVLKEGRKEGKLPDVVGSRKKIFVSRKLVWASLSKVLGERWGDLQIAGTWWEQVGARL